MIDFIVNNVNLIQTTACFIVPSSVSLAVLFEYLEYKKES